MVVERAGQAHRVPRQGEQGGELVRHVPVFRAAVRQVEEVDAVGPDAQMGERAPAFAATLGDQLFRWIGAAARMARASVADDADGHLAAAAQRLRDQPAAADHLVIGVGRDDEEVVKDTAHAVLNSSPRSSTARATLSVALSGPGWRI